MALWNIFTTPEDIEVDIASWETSTLSLLPKPPYERPTS